MKKLWDVLLFSSIQNKSRNYAELYVENHVNTRLRFVLYFRWTIRSKWQHIVIIHLLLDISKFESFGLKKWTMKGIKKQLSTKQWYKFSLKWYKCPLFVQYFPIYFVIFSTFELHAVRMRYIWKVFRVIQINMVDIRSQRFFRMNINIIYTGQFPYFAFPLGQCTCQFQIKLWYGTCYDQKNLLLNI